MERNAYQFFSMRRTGERKSINARNGRAALRERVQKSLLRAGKHKELQIK